MKVITGASGYIGGVLAHALAEREGTRSVRAMYRRGKGWASSLDIEWVPGDLMDADALRAAFAGADVVYHLAAMVSIDNGRADEIHATNVVGTRNVVEAALACRVRRLIHFSSIHAFDQKPADEVLDERRAPASGAHHDAYDRSKAAGEQEVRRGMERGLDAVVVNPTGVIGPFDSKPSHAGQFLLDLHRRRIPALVAGGFDWVDVRDVAAAALAAEERGRCGDNYLLAGGWYAARQLAHFAEQATGVRAPHLELPIFLARAWAPVQVSLDRRRGRRPLFTPAALNALAGGNRRISCAKARAELGFRPRHAAESVRDAYRWFAEQGRLNGSL